MLSRKLIIPKITNGFIFGLLVFRGAVPFIGFLFLSFYQPQDIGWLAATGWLAIVLYVYFLFGRKQKNSEIKKFNLLLSELILPAILWFFQIFQPNFNWANYFISLTILEVVTVGLGLAVSFLTVLKEAFKEGMLVVIILAFLFVGGSGVALLHPFLILWGEINQANLVFAFYSLALVFLVNLFNEIKWLYFFRKNLGPTSKTDFNDNIFEKNPAFILAAIFVWSVGVPLIHFLVNLRF